MGRRGVIARAPAEARFLLRLRLRCLELRRLLLLRLLLRQVVADDASAYGAYHRMVPRVVPGYTADDSPFQTTCRIGGAGRSEREQRGQDKC